VAPPTRTFWLSLLLGCSLLALFIGASVNPAQPSLSAAAEPLQQPYPIPPTVVPTPPERPNPNPPTVTPTSTATATSTPVPVAPPPPPPRSSGGGGSTPDIEVDLVIDQRVSTTQAQVGDTIDFTLVITYEEGYGRADDVRIWHELPPQMAIQEAATTWGDLTIQGSAIQVDIAELFLHDEVTVTLRSNVQSWQESRIGITSSVETTTDEIDLSNNQDSVILTFAPPVGDSRHLLPHPVAASVARAHDERGLM
jgi:hypothetical protein